MLLALLAALSLSHSPISQIQAAAPKSHPPVGEQVQATAAKGHPPVEDPVQAAAAKGHTPISQASSPKTEIAQPKKQIPLFLPPPGWQCARPKNASPCVQVGFVGKGSTEFHPSINLATEEIDISLKEYVKAVKEIHLSEKNTTWRDLGKFSMKAGSGRLTEITSTSAWGEIKMLQAILVEGDMAYILTAAALKKDYPEMQKEILQSLQSLSLEPDLFAPLPDESKRGEFQKLFASLGSALSQEERKKHWEALQKEVVEKGSEMGAHWQFLALQEAHAKIYPSAPLEKNP